MRKLIIIAFFILPFSSFAKQNQHCSWSAAKAGITLHYAASCDKENLSSLENVLNKVVALLNGRDTSLKILVFINRGQLSLNDDRVLNFISIGYDTLRAINDGYILQYYTDQETISNKKNHGYSTFDTRKSPLDINATDNNSTNNVGIKIIYDKEEPVWSEVIDAIVYSAKNVNTIKGSQRRDTVFFKMNGWHVSLVTLNSSSVNKIIGRSEAVPATQTKSKQNSHQNNFILSAVAIVIVITAIVITRKARDSRKQ